MYKKILKILLSIINLIYLNIYFFLIKKLKKKTFFFYHPKANLTLLHDFYLKKIVKNNKKFQVIFGSKIFKKGQFFLLESLLKYINFVDVFISNNVSDNFTRNSKKVYIHHDIYDTPLVDRSIEKNLTNRLIKYDYIILPSKKSLNVFNNLFKKNLNGINYIITNNYVRLNYLIKKYKNIKKKKDNKIETVIIAPTNYHSFKKINLLNKLEKIIHLLLNIKLNVIYRPHPSNLGEKHVKYLEKKFKDFKNFYFDKSPDYFQSYAKSDIMITDLSGTAYTYALMTKSPVVFFSQNQRYLKDNRYNNLNYFEDRKKIGFIIKSIIRLESFFIKNKNKFRYKQKTINIKKIFNNNFKNKKNIFMIINDHLYNH